MEPWMIALIVASIVVVALVAWYAWDHNRSARLRKQFSPEYNWAITETGNRRTCGI